VIELSTTCAALAAAAITGGALSIATSKSAPSQQIALLSPSSATLASKISKRLNKSKAASKCLTPGF
jgi:hypothetical protein